jgi:L,D-transpeptidase YcbB
MYVVVVSFLCFALMASRASAQTLPAAPPMVSPPTFDEGSVQRLKEALATYMEHESRGGWPALPLKAKFTPGGKSALVSQLRHRLVVSGDLAADKERGEVFDADVTSTTLAD